MADKPVRTFGPSQLSTVTTINILATPSGIYNLLRMLWFCNTTGVAATVSLWVGAPSGNAAGTELVTGLVIPANAVVPYYFSPGIRFDNGTNLVGGSSANNAITVIGMGYQAVP